MLLAVRTFVCCLTLVAFSLFLWFFFPIRSCLDAAAALDTVLYDSLWLRMWISHLELYAMLSLWGGKNALLSSGENAYIPSAWAIHYIGSHCLFYYTTRVGTWWLKTTLAGAIESIGKSMSNYWTGFEWIGHDPLREFPVGYIDPKRFAAKTEETRK